MFFSRQQSKAGSVALRALVVSPESDAERILKPALASAGRFSVEVVRDTFERAEPRLTGEDIAVVVACIDSASRTELVALQRFIARTGGRLPVVVVTDGFDEALARWFLQIRVADFVKRPIDAAELARTCLKAIDSQTPDRSGGATSEAEFYAFLPAAGGVGVTTLAIQTAFLLMRSGGRRSQTNTCLIDLDFQNGACADHLDVEPRLILDEIVPNPERLDDLLLDVMLSEHPSGLKVLAAPNRPAEMRTFDPAVVTRLLDLAARRFDKVVIDLPRTWFPWTDDVLVGADRVYIVTEMTVPGLRMARRLTTAIADRLGEAVKPAAIVNRFESSLFGTGLKRSDIEAALGSALAGCVANNYRQVREAIDRGVPLEDVKASSNVLADLRRILTQPVPEKGA
jgi:pilus assembly protein CpaE